MSKEVLPNHCQTIMVAEREKVDRLVRRQHTEPYRVCRRVNILRDYPDDKIKIYP